MKNYITIFVILFFVWFLLNNTLQVDVLIVGLIVSALVTTVVGVMLCVKCNVFSDLKYTPKAILNTFLFLAVFFMELVKSNIDVARRVLAPTRPINPGIVEVKTKLKSKFARMLLANSITLTPGTLTIETRGDSFFIHWIDVKDINVEKASNELIRKFEKYLEEIYD